MERGDFDIDAGEDFLVIVQRTVRVRAAGPRAARAAAVKGEPQGTTAFATLVERPGLYVPSEIEAVFILTTCEACDVYATEDDDRDGWTFEDGSGAVLCPACTAKAAL